MNYSQDNMRFSHPRGEVLDGISTPKRGDGVIGGGGFPRAFIGKKRPSTKERETAVQHSLEGAQIYQFYAPTQQAVWLRSLTVCCRGIRKHISTKKYERDDCMEL